MTGGVNAQLFTEILNHYVFFFEADNPEVLANGYHGCENVPTVCPSALQA